MWGWLKGKKRTNSSPSTIDDDSPLMLATDDRRSFTETPNSKELAEKLLAEAQAKAADMRAGSKVSVTIDSRYPGIHHMELDLSIMMKAGDYGLEWVNSFNNTITLMKI